MSISALKHTHQLRNMDSTLRMCATISPQQRQLFCPRQGESRSTTLNFQLHRRQLLAVGWELQNSSPTECVWRTKNTLNKFPAKIDGLPVEGHKEKSFPGSSPIQIAKIETELVSAMRGEQWHRYDLILVDFELVQSKCRVSVQLEQVVHDVTHYYILQKK